MKPNTETVNGPETMERLDAVVRKVFSVSHDEMLRREAAYQKTRPGLQGKKRGRKPGKRAENQ